MHLAAWWLVQAPVPVVGAATPDPPVLATSNLREWRLGGALRSARSMLGGRQLSFSTPF